MEIRPLRDAFGNRQNRFSLLEKGILKAGFETHYSLLEPGCAGGDAAKYLEQAGFRHITGIDIDESVVLRAAASTSALHFLCADACSLPFDTNSFDGIYSEAAFSVIPDKLAAAGEYARVLKPGARLLLNDFTLRSEIGTESDRACGIPCLEGVQTMGTLKACFSAAGFSCIYEREEFSELMRIAISLSKTYDVAPAQIGGYILSSFGKNGFVNDFFAQTHMSYCQMVFEKRK